MKKAVNVERQIIGLWLDDMEEKVGRLLKALVWTDCLCKL